MVGAGQDFPLALFGHPGCGYFERVEVEANGFDIQVRVVGRVSMDPECPQLNDCEWEDWTYLGLVWLPAPNPGSYSVTIMDYRTLTVIASGGSLEDPACDDACAYPEMDDRTWSRLHQSDQAVTATCAGHRDLDVPLFLGGECQNYFVINASWLFPPDVHHCTAAHLTFGAGPPFEAEASMCHACEGPNPPQPCPVWALGVGWNNVSGERAAEVFLLKGS